MIALFQFSHMSFSFYIVGWKSKIYGHLQQFQKLWRYISNDRHMSMTDTFQCPNGGFRLKIANMKREYLSDGLVCSSGDLLPQMATK